MTSMLSLLNVSILEELRETAGDEVFQEIGETFSEQIELIVGRFEDAGCLGDIDCLERNAHELAGAAGTFGAPALASCARDVMAAGRTGNLEQAQARIAPLTETGRATLAAFKCYCASLS